MTTKRNQMKKGPKPQFSHTHMLCFWFLSLVFAPHLNPLPPVSSLIISVRIGRSLLLPRSLLLCRECLPLGGQLSDSCLRLQLLALLELSLKSSLDLLPHLLGEQQVASHLPLGLGLIRGLRLGLLCDRLLGNWSALALQLQLAKVELALSLLSIEAVLGRQGDNSLADSLGAAGADRLVNGSRHRDDSRHEFWIDLVALVGCDTVMDRTGNPFQFFFGGPPAPASMRKCDSFLGL